MSRRRPDANRHIETREMSLEEVAQVLGISAEAVRQHEKNALQKLRNWVKSGKHPHVNIAGKHWREE